MPGYPSFALSLVLALSASVTLTACNRVSDASEQELIQRAKDFEDKNNLKAGIIELKNALQKNPNSIEARQLLGQIYLKTQQGAEAEKELGRALQLGRSREVLLPQIGEALLLMEQPQRVLDEVEVGDRKAAGQWRCLFPGVGGAYALKSAPRKNPLVLSCLRA